MKTILLSSIVLLGLTASSPAQVPADSPPPNGSPGPPGTSTNDLGSASVWTNPVVVAAPAPPVDPSVIREIRPVAGGAVADFAPHKVSFALSAAGGIQVQLPQPFASQQPVVLSSHLLGLCYWAISGTNAGQSAMIASLSDSTGQILPPTTVLYPDALGTGFDVLYNYSDSLIEQDILIKGQLPAPNSVLPATTDERDVMLGVITEFINPPEPRHSMGTVDLTQMNQQLGVDGPASMAGEDLLFGPMRILGAGHALLLGTKEGPAVPTVTTWTREATPDGFGGRCFVLDSVPYPLVKAQLTALPAGKGKGHGMFKPAPDLKTMLASIPRPSPAETSAFGIRHSAFSPLGTRPMSLAKVGTRPAPGLMIDYIFSLGNLLNIDFGGVQGTKVGPAQVGHSTNDYWNPWYEPYQTNYTLNNLSWANGTLSRVSVTVQNAPGDWANGASDPMMNTYTYSYAPPDNPEILITLTNLPSATYDFYLYGHGPTTDNSIFCLSNSLTNCGPFSTSVSLWNTLPNWVEGDEYVLFRGIPVVSNQPVSITVATNSLNYALICGLQATLSGNATYPCAPPPTGLVAWWRAEGNANDQAGTNNGAWEGTAAYSYGEVGRAFSFDGWENDVRVPASSSLNVGAGAGMTVEAWIKPSFLAWQPLVEWSSNTCGTYVWIATDSQGRGQLIADLIDTGGTEHGVESAGGTISAGAWQHVAATYDHNAGIGTLYINGQFSTNTDVGQFAPQTTFPVYFGLRPAGAGAGTRFAGLMDEVSIYNRALTAQEVYGLYAAGAAGKCASAPPNAWLINLDFGAANRGHIYKSGSHLQIGVTSILFYNVSPGHQLFRMDFQGTGAGQRFLD